MFGSLASDRKLLLIGGPCLAESHDLLFRTCDFLQELTSRLGIYFVFKASFDKANRSSGETPRGPGIEKGLEMLHSLRESRRVPVLTDVHSVEHVAPAAAVVDVLQVPALLCRQTDLVEACARSGRWVNVKKGQWMNPLDMLGVIQKITNAGGRGMITERGTSHGYNSLVFDTRSIPQMQSFGCPVVFDMTHSTQSMGGGKESGGDRRFASVHARAAIAVGAHGLFAEVHPDPKNAWSDSAVQLSFGEFGALLPRLVRLHEFMRDGYAPAQGGGDPSIRSRRAV